MTSTAIIVLNIFVLLMVPVELSNLQAGSSYYFEYDDEGYWFQVGQLGKFNLAESEEECASRYSAEVVKIMTGGQREAIEDQVSQRIPIEWDNVMMWTRNSKIDGTNVVMEIWKPGTGGRNGDFNFPPLFRSNGYICHKRLNLVEKTYTFEYDGDKYWFRTHARGSVSYATAQIDCAYEYSADVMGFYTEAQYAEVENQVQYRVPANYSEVEFWTRDSEANNTNVVMVVPHENSGEPIYRGNQLVNTQVDGYVCQKKINRLGYAYHFRFKDKDYTFVINARDSYNYTDAETLCTESYGASVASAEDGSVFVEMQRRIEYRIPTSLNEVKIWTSYNMNDATSIVIVVWRNEVGGTNVRETQPKMFTAHGYICEKEIE